MKKHFTQKDIKMVNEHIKSCPIWLAIKEIKIKTMSYHYTAIRWAEKITTTGVWWICRETGHSYIGDGNVKWCSHPGKSLAVFWKTKHSTAVRPNNCTLCIYENLYSHEKVLYTNV